MKNLKIRLTIVIPAIIISIIALVFNSTFAMAANSGTKINTGGKENTPVLQKGVNYLSQWHWYLPNITTDAVLNRDFAKFKQDGLKYISLPLYWYRLEGDTRGDFIGSNAYGDAFLANVNRVITTANQYGIQTMVDIHTLWGDDGTWCTPAYVKDPITGTRIELAIVRDNSMQQAFLDMFTHTVKYLKGTPGIWCWALNEPWYWPHQLEAPFNTIDQKENFISLFQKMKTISQNIDGRPFTVRFVSTHIYGDNNNQIKNIFTDDWGWDKRIFDSLDFVSFNAYIPDSPSLLNQWKTIVRNNVNDSINQGKTVWLSEFGYLTIDAMTYQSALDFFKTLKLNGILAWMWRSDKDEINPDPPNTNYNICASSTTGTGNQLYNIFVKMGSLP